MCGIFAWRPSDTMKADFGQVAREQFSALAERGSDDRGFLTFDAQGRLTGSEREALGRRGRDYLLERHDWRKLGTAYVEFCGGIARSQY